MTGLAGIAVGALTASGLGATAATAAPTDDSEARGQVLYSDLLDLQLLDAAGALAGSPSDPGPVTNPLDLQLLSAVSVDLGDNLVLPLVSPPGGGGLLDLGTLGAASAYAAAPGPTEATAAAGVLGPDGAIGFDPDNPGAFDYSRVDLTDLLDQLGLAGVTDAVVDDLALELGLLASTATAASGAAGEVDTTSQYAIAGARLAVRSPLVAGLAGTAETAIDTAGGVVDGALGAGGTLSDLVGGIGLNVDVGVATIDLGGTAATVQVAGLDAALDAAYAELVATPLQDDAGIVSVDLTTGQVLVDLEQLSYAPGVTGLNGLPANTDLLSAATLTTITNAVSEALGTLTERATEALLGALEAVALTIELPATVSVPNPLTPLDPDDSLTVGTTVSVQAPLGALTGAGDPADVVVSLGDLGVIGTVLDTLGLSLDGLIAGVTTPLVGALGGILGQTTGLVGGSLTPTLDAAVDPVLTALDPVLGALNQVAQITINEQLTGTDYLATEAFTVNALSLELLPALGAVNLDLGSSTVRAQAFTPTLTAADPVEPGATLAFDTAGWPPQAVVDVTLVNTDGTPVPGAPTVPVTTDATGAAAGQAYPVPADVADGAYTLRGVSGALVATDDIIVATEYTPTIAIAEDGQYAGETVTVTSDGWAPTTDVTLQLTDADGDPVGAPVTVASDPAGALPETEIPVPADAPAGVYTVVGTAGTEPAVTTAESDEVTIYAPTVTAPAEPVNAAQDAQVPVTGAGFPAATPLTVELRDADGDPVPGVDGAPLTADVTTDAEGAFETSFTLPAGTPDGAYTAVATDPAAGVEFADPFDVVSVYAAEVDVPDAVFPGQGLAVTGTGWPADTEVTLQLQDPTGAPVGDPVTVVTDAQGDLPAGTVLPVPADAEGGAYTVAATDETGNTGEDAVTVYTPALTADGPAYAGGTIPVTSVGWPPSRTLVLTLAGPDGAPVGEAVTVTTDASGAIPATALPVGDGGAGAYTVTAVDATGFEVTADVAVFAPDVAVADPVFAGDDAEVISGGWPADTEVSLQLVGPDGEPIGDPVVVTTDDAGELTGAVPVPADAAAGDYAVVATPVDGDGGARDAFPVYVPETIVDGPAYPGSEVEVDGGGWPPSTDVTVELIGPDGEPIGEPIAVTTDEDGNLPDDLTVSIPQGATAGDYVVEVSDGDGHTSTSGLAVYTPDVDAGGPVAPGDEVPVGGAGFPADTELGVVIVDEDGNQVGDPGTVVTDGEGGFSTGVPLPAETEPGDYTVVVTTPDGTAFTDGFAVVADGATGGDGAGAAGAGGSGGAGGLAVTGGELAPVLPLALLLMVLGAALLLARRRHQA